MPSSFWGGLFLIIVVSIIADSVVKIIRASKSSGGPKDVRSKLEALEQDVATVEQDLEDAQERIVVLEKIVTDDKNNLRREIDDLAKNG